MASSRRRCRRRHPIEGRALQAVGWRLSNPKFLVEVEAPASFSAFSAPR